MWEELTSGRSLAVDTFCLDGRCHVVLRAATEPSPVLTTRNIALLRQVLLGTQQKVVAIDLGVSVSYIAGIVAQCARAMGFDCSARRIPTLMLMAARASSSGSSRTRARAATFAHRDVTYQVLSVERPSPPPRLGLSPAEQEVVSLLVERHSNAEIADARRTSIRTVANQLGSAIHKLNARGRSEVLSRVLACVVE
jgi:DNA-binding CsgD family transcriptional regulator